MIMENCLAPKEIKAMGVDVIPLGTHININDANDIMV